MSIAASRRRRVASRCFTRFTCSSFPSSWPARSSNITTSPARWRHVRTPMSTISSSAFPASCSASSRSCCSPTRSPAAPISSSRTIRRSLGFVEAWAGVIFFTFQIYFDFSGYSDMAIGLARMFGFRLLENFNKPYVATSITDFWRRWHMSLTSWIREYFYFPLGGNRRGDARTHFNLWICFFASGFWHGAAWTYIVWGAYNGVFLVLDRLFLVNRWSGCGLVRQISRFSSSWSVGRSFARPLVSAGRRAAGADGEALGARQRACRHSSRISGRGAYRRGDLRRAAPVAFCRGLQLGERGAALRLGVEQRAVACCSSRRWRRDSPIPSSPSSISGFEAMSDAPNG